jgi:hypothetical protein
MEIARDGIEPSPPPYQSDMLPIHHRAVMGTSDACGIRTQPDQSESLVTSPEVERADEK